MGHSHPQNSMELFVNTQVLKTQNTYLSSNLEEISENNYYTVISSDNAELFSFDYDNNTLYYLSLKEDNIKEIVGEIVGFGVTPDFTHIFYITEDNELYVANTDGSEKKKLDDDVSSENYVSGLNFVGIIIPRVLGNEYIIYGTNNGDIYMCDLNGKKTEIKAELDFGYYYNFANDYNNTYGRREGGFRTSRLFPSRDFITYTNNGNLYKIDSNGKTSLLLENVE